MPAPNWACSTCSNAGPGWTGRNSATALDLQDRALDILLLGVTALRLVEQREDRYHNNQTISRLFSEGRWEVVTAVIGFEAYINYPGLSDFTESLQENTNVGLRRVPGSGPTLYHRLTGDPELSKVFYRYMGTWSNMAAGYLIDSVDFASLHRVLDVGGGDATIAVAVAQAFPHLHITVLELPGVVPLAQRRVDEAGVGDRVQVIATDMFADPSPPVMMARCSCISCRSGRSTRTPSCCAARTRRCRPAAAWSS